MSLTYTEDMPNIEPITRKEMFLAKAGGLNAETLEPTTREEYFLSKIQNGSCGVTSWNDLKDKPFGDIINATELYNNTITVTGVGYGTTIFEEIDIWDNYRNGENKFRVIYDNVVYDNLSAFDIDDGFYLGIGNGSLYNSNFYSDTKEPFLLMFRLEGRYEIITTDTSEASHTLTVYGLESSSKQLDEKYIPDTIARITDIPTDNHINKLINNVLGVIENGTY